MRVEESTSSSFFFFRRGREEEGAVRGVLLSLSFRSSLPLPLGSLALKTHSRFKKSSRKSRFACVLRALATFARRETVSNWTRTKCSQISRSEHPFSVQNRSSV